MNEGKAEIKTQTLYPYEIVERLKGSTPYAYDHPRFGIEEDLEANAPLEAMWKNLPDYVGDGGNVLVIADTSGSMMGRPMYTSTSLAMYFAERNHGPFKGLYMTFSGEPQFIQINPGDSLYTRYVRLSRGPWGQNTNLLAVFDRLLGTAVHIGASAEDMPKALVIITDMEIDSCEAEGSAAWNTIVDRVKAEFEKNGYKMPNIVFWNVASRHDTYLAKCKFKGVQMVSGSSASIFKSVLGFIDGMTPLDAVKQVLSNERYSAIKV